MMNKIVSFQSVDSALSTFKSKGTLVIAGGVFDILHEGHKKFLAEAKKQGKTLLIILESDEATKKRKGETRPINKIENRALILEKIPEVDFILKIPDFKSDQEYYNLVKKLEPDIIAVTKNDPLLSVKKDQAQQIGAKVVEVIERLPNLSTTELLKGD